MLLNREGNPRVTRYTLLTSAFGPNLYSDQTEVTHHDEPFFQKLANALWREEGVLPPVTMLVRCPRGNTASQCQLQSSVLLVVQN